jgi:hypothetical protein
VFWMSEKRPHSERCKKKNGEGLWFIEDVVDSKNLCKRESTSDRTQSPFCSFYTAHSCNSYGSPRVHKLKTLGRDESLLWFTDVKDLSMLRMQIPYSRGKLSACGLRIARKIPRLSPMKDKGPRRISIETQAQITERSHKEVDRD